MINKTLMLIIITFLIVGCESDKIVNNEELEVEIKHPLKGLCFERFVTQRITIDDDIYIGDVKIELTSGDSTYSFITTLLGPLPKRPEDTDEVVRVGGYLWLSEKLSDHEYTYVVKHEGGEGWHFNTQKWVPFDGYKSEWKRITVGPAGEINFLGNVYTPCK